MINRNNRTGDEEFFLSVVVPVRNEGRRLSAFIASIVEGRSHRFPLEFVVADDCSTDGCCNLVRDLYTWQRDKVEICIVRLPRWSGIPYARNLGASKARGGILFITDANVRFPINWDLPIRRCIAPNRALCATIADESSSFRGFGGILHLPSMGFNWLRSPAIYGGYVPLSPCTGTILPKELFRRVGGYDTAMPVYGAAESEFSVRLWLSGAEIVSVPDLVLLHRFRPASERRPFLEAIQLVQVHNYLRFALLYLDAFRAAQVLHHYAASSPELFHEALRRVWSGDVWLRRDELIRALPKSFESFLQRFGLLGAQGRFAVGQNMRVRLPAWGR